ncbi:MAG TPA: EAL domain-containing protein [Steroidobacteraceae bacterium]|nr:EAL domain-containing protein [Steroidobacteraceae bacterium]
MPAGGSILSDTTAVPVIVFAPSRDAVEAVNSHLRRAGHAVHCTWIPELGDLGDALTQINPELLVCQPRAAGELSAVSAVRTQLTPEVPLVALIDNADEASIAAAIAAGARDAVTLARPDRLRAVIERELRSYRLERALNTTLQSARDYRKQLEAVLERSTDAVVQVQEGIIVDANASWLNVFGIADAAALVGQPLMDLFEESSHTALKGALVACLQGRWTDQVLKADALRHDGTVLSLEFVLSQGVFDGEPCVRLIVPARKRDERELASELADSVRRDPGTGLLYRRPLLEAIAARTSTPARGGVRYLALARLDKFAELEKEIGPVASEQLLTEFAGMLREHASPTDIAGRFSGTSFLLLLERGNERDVEAWAEQLVARTAKHVFHVGAKTLGATCSVGLGVVPHGSPHIDDAVLDAVDACRRARHQGGGRVAMLDRADADSRVQAYDQVWVRHIKAALMENRFRLVQQPVASLRGDDPQMFDVLVRMLDHQKKEVLPADFMAAAERNDLLRNIDRWVVGASLSFAAQRRPGCLFVRLAKDSMLDPSFPGWLDGQRKASGAEPGRVCFQVTEDVAAAYIKQAKALADAVKARGFRFAIERFGGGRDSHGLLAAMPVDFIKIDGALIQNLAGDIDLQQKVRALVDAASKRRIATIAERVEDANTMAVLWQLGVQYIQGYFVNAPEDVHL